MGIKLENNLGTKFKLTHANNAGEINLTSKDLTSTAYTIEAIEDLATVPVEFNTVIVKDINRGGVFVSKTEVDIDPNTGNIYIVDNGRVFAKQGGGFWVRQDSNDLNLLWYNANGDNTTDNTSIFTTLKGRKVYVPDGTFKTEFADTDNLYGDGSINLNGSIISFNSNSNKILTQKKLNTFDLTLKEPFQGIAYLNINGVDKIFFTQKSSGDTYKTNERMKIGSATLSNDGSTIIQSSVVMSSEINLGHGQDLSAELINGEVYLWTESPTTKNNDGAKGISKIKWNNGTPIIEDTYLLCGASGSGENREYLYQGIPCISSDGKYIIYMGDYPNSNGFREVLVFDRTTIETSSNTINEEPITSFKITPSNSDDGRIMQGIASDGNFIYILYGYYNAFSKKGILKYDMNGIFIKNIPITINSAEYGIDGLLDNSLYTAPNRVEPEGITIKGNELLVCGYLVFSNNPSIVSYDGSNYAYIGTGATVSPNNSRYWIKTNKTATDGEYSESATYTAGTSALVRNTIYSVKEKENEANEYDINEELFINVSNSSLVTQNGRIDVNFGSKFEVSSFSEATNKRYTNIDYENGTLNIYDNRIISRNNTESLSLQMNNSSSNPTSYIRGKGDLLIRAKSELSDGAGINLYGKSSTNAGQLRMYAIDTANSNALRTIVFRGNAPSLYAIEDNTYSLGIGAFRWSNIYAGTGAINTSDAREKTFSNIPEVEKQVAIELKGLMRRFKFNDAIETKGIDNARIHYGTSAQEVISVFEKYGLDAMRYAMVCYDEWEEERDEEGNITIEAGNRYGIRYEELLCFIISAM